MFSSLKKTFLITVVALSLFFSATPILAQEAKGFDLKLGIIGNLSTIAPDCISKGDCGWCDFISLMVILQKAILSIFGGIALILIIWGGVSIVTAAGNEENIAANKKLVTSTLLGVLIILAAYFLVHFIVIAVSTPAGKTPNGLLFSGNWWEAQCADKVQICEGIEEENGKTTIKPGSLSAINSKFTYKCEKRSQCKSPNGIIRLDGACYSNNKDMKDRLIDKGEQGDTICCARGIK